MAFKENSQPTIISDGTIFEGNLYVKGQLKIDGKFQGVIKTDNFIEIGITGKVKSDLSSKKVTVAGTLIGNILATEETTIKDTGRVLGNIKTSKLFIENGSVIKGAIEVAYNQEKNIDKHIKESFDSTPNFDAISGHEKDKK